MRQILIVKGGDNPVNKGMTDNKVANLDKLAVGAISFMEFGSDTALVNSQPTKNFAIALGRKNGQHPFIISEVDVNTLTVTKALPYAGKKFKVVITVPTTVVDNEYTLLFYKKGVVPHERNSWTVSFVAKTTTAATEAAVLKAVIDSKISDKFNFTTSINGAEVTVEAANGEDWEVKVTDSMPASAIAVTHAEKAIGDKAFVQDLASRCAYGKGFADTYRNGDSTIPGYPEDVEDFVLNVSGANRNGTDATNGKYSTTGYAIYTLRFQVGRDASKQRDERVWQEVYIACPIGNNENTNIDKILPEGDYLSTRFDAVNDAISDAINSL